MKVVGIVLLSLALAGCTGAQRAKFVCAFGNCQVTPPQTPEQKAEQLKDLNRRGLVTP